ncbi:hypothetical protein [Mesorhizobium sp. 1B3]|uniref:hypothetical protein n=1 Tax=Mesorhizobium sp. 1B3 TaxID=3243599 RepID=UPI003D9961F2
MIAHNETAAPTGIGNGGIGKIIATSSYLTVAPAAIEICAPEYAARKVASRFRLRIETARVVCHLAGLAVCHE